MVGASFRCAIVGKGVRRGGWGDPFFVDFLFTAARVENLQRCGGRKVVQTRRYFGKTGKFGGGGRGKFPPPFVFLSVF